MNTNIAMQDTSPQFDSPVNALAKALQIKQAQQENQMGQMKMDEYRRGVASDNALAQMLAGGKSGADVATGLAAQGYGKQSLAYTNQMQAMAKEKAATEKDQLANAHSKLALGSQILGSVTDQASYDQARATAQSHGLDVSNMPAQFDPAFVKAKFDEGVDAKTKLEQYWKQKGYDTPDANAVLQAKTSTDNNTATNATSRANNSATVGASYANADATRSIAQATRDAANVQRDQATEMKMGDDYRAQSKGFKEVGDAYRQINSTLDLATKSPAATLAAATKFMKLLDPGSVVRESELGMALAASGVFDRATNYYNTLKNGRVLTANQVQDFKNITQQIYGAAQTGQKLVDAQYTKQANAYKLRPEMVVQDLGQNTPAATSPRAAAPGKVVNFGDLK